MTTFKTPLLDLPPTSLVTGVRAISIALKQLYGQDPIPVLRSVGIDPALLYENNLRLSSRAMTPLWRRCLEITGDEAFGVRAAHYLQSSCWYGVDLALSTCSTFGEAIQRLTQLLSVISTVMIPSIKEDSTGNWHLSFPGNGDVRVEFTAIDFFTYSMTALLERLSGYPAGQLLTHIHTRRRTPSNTDMWQVPGVSVLFEQPDIGLILRKEALDLPLAGSNLHLQAQVEKPILQYLIQHQMPVPLWGLRTQLTGLLSSNPTQALFASQLGLTERTLRSLLEAQGSSFSMLLDQTREFHTITLLHIPELTINDIAQRTGFSKASHLIRAFQRWQGMSPQQYRQQHLPYPTSS